MKSILDASFRYTPSFSTNLAKTFARIRSDQRKNAEWAVRATADALNKAQLGNEVCVAPRRSGK